MKKEEYSATITEWLLPIIVKETKKYLWLHPSRFSKDELVHEAYIHTYERLIEIKPPKHASEPLVRWIAKTYLFKFVLVSNWPVSAPAGTLSKPEGRRKVRETLALFLEYDDWKLRERQRDYEMLKRMSEKEVIMGDIELRLQNRFFLGRSKSSLVQDLKAEGEKNARKRVDKAHENLKVIWKKLGAKDGRALTF